MTDLLKTGILHEGNRNQERSDLISVRKIVKKDNGRRKMTTTRLEFVGEKEMPPRGWKSS